jgi:hypothetical protein
MSDGALLRTVVSMLHDPTTRRLIAEARLDELRRDAKPRMNDEDPRPRAKRRLRRLLPR